MNAAKDRNLVTSEKLLSLLAQDLINYFLKIITGSVFSWQLHIMSSFGNEVV